MTPDGLDIFLRCGNLLKLIEANRSKSALVKMEYVVEDGEDIYHFTLIKHREVLRMKPEERERLIKARPLVKKKLAQFQRDLETLAKSHGLGEFLWGRGMNNDRSTYRTYRPTGNPGYNPSDTRNVFETFDDGRSVWTFESNWKPKSSQ